MVEVSLSEDDCEDGVRSAAGLVHVCRCHRSEIRANTPCIIIITSSSSSVSTATAAAAAAAAAV